MFQGLCADTLDAKWTVLSELDFPINAKKIAAADCLNENLRQFFFAEINHYSRKILTSLTTNTNISQELSTNTDGDAVTNILYDWVEFAEDEIHSLLKFAVETELFFLISPARCLANFLFKSNQNNNDSSNPEDRPIEDIINELDFISDKQGILSSLKSELEEQANIQKNIAINKFINIANDIVFNLYQKQSIEDFLLPCQHYIEFTNKEAIPVDFVELFLMERDLTGVLTEIKIYATTNNKQTLSYKELYDEIGRLTGKLPAAEENTITNLDLPKESSNTTKIDEEAAEEIELSEEEFTENEDTTKLVEAKIAIDEEPVEPAEAEAADIEVTELEDNAELTEDASAPEDVPIEDEIVDLAVAEEAAEEIELPEEEFTENEDTTKLVEAKIAIDEEPVGPAEAEVADIEVAELEDSTELTEDVSAPEDVPIEDEIVDLAATEEAAEEVELPEEEFTKNEDTAKLVETEIAIDEEPAEAEVADIEVAELEDNAELTEDVSAPEEAETLDEDFVAEFDAEAEEPATTEEDAVAPVAEPEAVIAELEGLEEFAEAVEQEVDNAMAALDKEEIVAEETVAAAPPKAVPVAVPPTPAMQEVITNSNTINSRMAEMRSNYINSKISEMRTLGKTLFEIEQNYLEMEAEQLAKILQLLKE